MNKPINTMDIVSKVMMKTLLEVNKGRPWRLKFPRRGKKMLMRQRHC